MQVADVAEGGSVSVVVGLGEFWSIPESDRPMTTGLLALSEAVVTVFVGVGHA